MSPSRRTALIGGIWFAITFIASIPALLLYDPVLNDTRYILGAGSITRIEWRAPGSHPRAVRYRDRGGVLSGA